MSGKFYLNVDIEKVIEGIDMLTSNSAQLKEGLATMMRTETALIRVTVSNSQLNQIVKSK